MRIVRQQPHGADSQLAQDSGANAVIAQVFFKPELEVCFDRIQFLVWQGIARISLPTRCPALLMEIDEDTGFGGTNLIK